MLLLNIEDANSIYLIFVSRTTHVKAVAQKLREKIVSLQTDGLTDERSGEYDYINMLPAASRETDKHCIIVP